MSHTPLLIGMFGYPGSGKTYFSEQLCEKMNWFHLSSDRIRLKMFSDPQYTKEEHRKLFDFMDYVAEELLRVRVSVVYDANFNFVDSRHKLERIASDTGATYKLVWIQTDEMTALERLEHRHKTAASTMKDIYRPIEKSIFEKLKNEMQIPAAPESAITIDGHVNFTEQLRQFKEQL